MYVLPFSERPLGGTYEMSNHHFYFQSVQMRSNEGNSLEYLSILHAKMQYLQNHPISSKQLKPGLLWSSYQAFVVQEDWHKNLNLVYLL